MIDDHGYDGNHINVIVINHLELDEVNIAIKGASLFRINQWLTIYQSVNITNFKKNEKMKISSLLQLII